MRLRRGQEEAPIEILIAVTLLTFVLILGIYSYNNMCRTQFEQKMKSSIHTFVVALESVYQGSIGNSKPVSLDFTPEGCGSFDEVRILVGTESTCLKQAGYEDCLTIVLTLNTADPTQKQHLITEAMSIPANDVTITYKGSQEDWDYNSPYFKGAGIYTISKIDKNTIDISPG